MVLVGGIGRFEGPILGAIIFFLIENWLGSAGVWYLIVLGLTALLFSLFLPKGIWGISRIGSTCSYFLLATECKRQPAARSSVLKRDGFRLNRHRTLDP
jgi:hypothetical protein